MSQESDTDKDIQLHIVTLKTYLAELALERALDEQIDDIGKICDRAKHLLQTELHTTKEFVKVTQHYIQVGINCDLVDNDIIMLAFEMVAKLPSFEPGTTIEFGESVQVYENNISRRMRTN